MTSARSTPRPRNWSLAKANPASVQNSTVPTVIAPETSTELRIALPIGACSSAAAKFSNRLALGRNGGGVAAISALVCEPATRVQ